MGNNQKPYRWWRRILSHFTDGIRRKQQVYALKHVDSGKLVRVRKGFYVLSDDVADEYALLQAQSSKAHFSYGTAVYLWGVFDRAPHTIDVTVSHRTNMTTVKRNNENLRCHYVQPKVYEIGITATTSPQGAEVRLYDKERCICDLIRGKKTEMQLYTQAIKEYYKGKPNSRKLLKYERFLVLRTKSEHT